jgi:hypothetical protein
VAVCVPQVVSQEAVRAGVPEVACSALALLHDAVVKGQVTALSEADVLRAHIRYALLSVFLCVHFVDLSFDFTSWCSWLLACPQGINQ